MLQPILKLTISRFFSDLQIFNIDIPNLVKIFEEFFFNGGIKAYRKLKMFYPSGTIKYHYCISFTHLVPHTYEQ